MASLYLLRHGGPAAEFPPFSEGRPVSIKLTLYLDKKGEYRVADERRAAA
jgi:hypothetical protein